MKDKTANVALVLTLLAGAGLGVWYLLRKPQPTPVEAGAARIVSVQYSVA